MSLAQFLNWLFGVIDRVIGFFGDRFSIYIDILNNLKSKFDGWIEPVKQYILDQLQRAKDTITGWVNEQVTNTRTWVNGLYNQFTGWVNTQLAAISATFTGSINDVIGFINKITDFVNGAIETARTDLSNWVTANLELLSSQINQSFSFLEPIRAIITTITGFFEADNIKKVQMMISDGLPVITGFISNPIGFILDIIGDSLLDTIGWVLAVSLGSTGDNLDLTPPWKKKK